MRPSRGIPFDASHKLHAYRGVVFCTACGKWAMGRPRHLGEPCVPADSKYRQDVLSRLRRGMRPHPASDFELADAGTGIRPVILVARL